MRQQLFTNHDKYHLHKILGVGCLFNFFLRIYWLIVYDSMFIHCDYNNSLLIPVVHLILSLSSFIFQKKIEVAKIYLPILYVIFRLQYNMNKYYLMFHIFILNIYIQYKNDKNKIIII